MVTLLLTSVLIFGLVAIAIYFWQKPANNSQTIDLPLPPPPQHSGLFSDCRHNQLAAATENQFQTKNKVLENARNGDKSALDEAHASDDPALYDEVLSIFVAQADSAPKVLSLVSHVTRNGLRVNQALAQKFLDYRQEFPDKNSTAKMLHVAALSDDADTYRKAIEIVLQSWREGKLNDLSAVELQSLFNGEFWILSSTSRSSGAGFVLKRTLSTANRELDPTNNPNHSTASS